MLKILFKPTGNIYTLPDEDALRIKASDCFNYTILDAGYQEENEEKVSPKTVKELVMKQEEAIKEQELADNPPAKPKSELKYENMKKNELLAVCKKLNLTADVNATKAQLVEKINKNLGIK
jgi:hypothetical protein